VSRGSKQSSRPSRKSGVGQLLLKLKSHAGPEQVPLQGKGWLREKEARLREIQNAVSLLGETGRR